MEYYNDKVDCLLCKNTCYSIVQEINGRIDICMKCRLSMAGWYWDLESQMYIECDNCIFTTNFTNDCAVCARFSSQSLYIDQFDQFDLYYNDALKRYDVFIDDEELEEELDPRVRFFLLKSGLGMCVNKFVDEMIKYEDLENFDDDDLDCLFENNLTCIIKFKNRLNIELQPTTSILSPRLPQSPLRIITPRASLLRSESESLNSSVQRESLSKSHESLNDEYEYEFEYDESLIIESENKSEGEGELVPSFYETTLTPSIYDATMSELDEILNSILDMNLSTELKKETLVTLPHLTESIVESSLDSYESYEYENYESESESGARKSLTTPSPSPSSSVQENENDENENDESESYEYYDSYESDESDESESESSSENSSENSSEYEYLYETEYEYETSSSEYETSSESSSSESELEMKSKIEQKMDQVESEVEVKSEKKPRLKYIEVKYVYEVDENTTEESIQRILPNLIF